MPTTRVDAYALRTESYENATNQQDRQTILHDPFTRTKCATITSFLYQASLPRTAYHVSDGTWRVPTPHLQLSILPDLLTERWSLLAWTWEKETALTERSDCPRGTGPGLFT